MTGSDENLLDALRAFADRHGAYPTYWTVADTEEWRRRRLLTAVRVVE